jgi:hypothetical protein
MQQSVGTARRRSRRAASLGEHGDMSEKAQRVIFARPMPIVTDGRIERVSYPVVPSGRRAADVPESLGGRARAGTSA